MEKNMKFLRKLKKMLVLVDSTNKINKSQNYWKF